VHLPFNQSVGEQQLQADLCIVGAGAAGQTLARAALERGLRVLLLESGGQDFHKATQDLYAGPNLGHEYYELEHARLRFFGGTTNIWGGRCVPLAPIDFQRRSWVPHSGWPLTLAALEDGYRRAAADLQVPEDGYDDALWQQLDTANPFADSAALDSWFWQFDPVAERFGWQRAQALLQHERSTVLLGANVTEINVNADGSAVTGLAVANLAGARRQVTASNYVLACGGIENARLLLASRSVQPAGVGNDHDQVGRYFMEHPHARLAAGVDGTGFNLWHASRKRTVPGSGRAVAPAFVPSETAQEQHRLLNSAVTFKFKAPPGTGVPAPQQLYLKLKHDLSPGRAQRVLWHFYRSLRVHYQDRLRSGVLKRQARRGKAVLHVMLRAEQAPNPDSRVRLSEDKDALGMPRGALDWRLTDLDRCAAQRQAALIRDEFAARGMGTLQLSEWLDGPGVAWPVDPTVSNHPIGGYHHMGTTRMSHAPHSGVVDSHCRVHGYANLHVAGSSVFPTAGWANPTLTIMALAHRLAEEITRPGS
jgi:choline dehydrogenase-like flavoprotein